MKKAIECYLVYSVIFFFFRSTCLLLQAALPCLLYANGEAELVLRGGTNADMAPPIDYFEWVCNLLLFFKVLNFF